MPFSSCAGDADQMFADGMTQAVMAAACEASLFGSGGRSDCECISQRKMGFWEAGTYRVEYDPDHQAAAWTARNVLAVAHVCDGNLEAVTAGTGMVVDLERLIIKAIFDLDFVVQIELFVRHCACV